MGGAVSRFRPIMLTAISTVLGLIPIAPTCVLGADGLRHYGWPVRRHRADSPRPAGALCGFSSRQGNRKTGWLPETLAVKQGQDNQSNETPTADHCRVSSLPLHQRRGRPLVLARVSTVSPPLTFTMRAGIRQARHHDSLGCQQTKHVSVSKRQGVDVEVGASVVGRFHYRERAETTKRPPHFSDPVGMTMTMHRHCAASKAAAAWQTSCRLPGPCRCVQTVLLRL